MRYKFDDILNEDMYKSCRVLFVTGQHNIFNNIVVDRLKKMCIESDELQTDAGLLEEFGIEDIGAVTIPNSIPFDYFMQIVHTPSINGKWFSNVDLGTMTKRQQDWLKNYLKEPSENGVLCLVGTEFKDYRYWLNYRALNADPHVHLISLSFPSYKSLKPLIKDMFNERNVEIEDRAVELFMIRMSSSYDEYDKIIDKICIENLPDGYLVMEHSEVPMITYEMALQSLRGIENFVLDDFLEKIVTPLSSDKVTGKKIVYRMMGYLLEEYGPRKLVSKLNFKVDELLDFRLFINKGYIPVLVNYSVEEAKKLIGEDEPITKKSDYQFKKMSQLASKTSLKDWLYIKLILSNVNEYDENSYIKALYSVISRSVLTESRINNDIGIESLFSYGIDYIDSVRYLDCDTPEDNQDGQDNQDNPDNQDNQ